MASAAERRAAQRQLAKQIKSGTYQPTLRKTYLGSKKRNAVAYATQFKDVPVSDRPAKGTQAANDLARAASYIFNNPDEYEEEIDSGEYDWMEDYWYHDG